MNMKNNEHLVKAMDMEQIAEMAGIMVMGHMLQARKSDEDNEWINHFGKLMKDELVDRMTKWQSSLLFFNQLFDGSAELEGVRYVVGWEDDDGNRHTATDQIE